MIEKTAAGANAHGLAGPRHTAVEVSASQWVVVAAPAEGALEQRALTVVESTQCLKLMG